MEEKNLEQTRATRDYNACILYTHMTATIELIKLRPSWYFPAEHIP
jgi:hypothetical protein